MENGVVNIKTEDAILLDEEAGIRIRALETQVFLERVTNLVVPQICSALVTIKTSCDLHDHIRKVWVDLLIPRQEFEVDRLGKISLGESRLEID